MKIRQTFFNIILLLALVTGCATSDKDKEITLLRIHIETTNSAGDGKPVSICRAAPVTVLIDPSPFIDERDVAKATVIDWMGGFAIQLELNFHGRVMLENTTRLHPGRRLAIHCEFSKARWLAAPLIARPISDGQLAFTPDATREEAERIARGLNNIAAEVAKNTFK